MFCETGRFEDLSIGEHQQILTNVSVLMNNYMNNFINSIGYLDVYYHSFDFHKRNFRTYPDNFRYFSIREWKYWKLQLEWWRHDSNQSVVDFQ